MFDSIMKEQIAWNEKYPSFNIYLQGISIKEGTGGFEDDTSGFKKVELLGDAGDTFVGVIHPSVLGLLALRSKYRVWFRPAINGYCSPTILNVNRL